MGADLERLKHLAFGFDVQAVRELGREWARRGDGWGEAIGVVLEGEEQWPMIAERLDMLTQEWREDAATLLLWALSQRERLAVRTPLDRWVKAEAGGKICPQLSWVTRLELNAFRLSQEIVGWKSAKWERVFQSPFLRGVRELVVHAMGREVNMWSALVESSWIGGVRTLHLPWAANAPSLSDLLGEQLAKIPWERLEILDLNGHELGNRTAIALAQSAHLTKLQSLDVSRNPIQRQGIVALIESPLCGQLKQLRLPDHAVFADLARAPTLAAAPWPVLWAVLPHAEGGSLSDALLLRIVEHFGDFLQNIETVSHNHRGAALALGQLARAAHILARFQQLSAEEAEATLQRGISALKNLRGEGASWNLYFILRALPVRLSARFEALQALLDSSLSLDRSPPPGVRPHRRYLISEMLEDLASLSDLTAVQELARLKTLRRFSVQVTVEFGWEALIQLRRLDPAPRTSDAKIIEHLTKTLQSTHSATWLHAVIERFGFPLDTQRSLAHIALTAPTFSTRAWAFQTLASADFPDHLMRDAVLLALSEQPNNQTQFAGSALFSAFANGWLPDTIQSLSRDRFTPEDTHQYPTLRPFRTRTLWDAVKSHIQTNSVDAQK